VQRFEWLGQIERRKETQRFEWLLENQWDIQSGMCLPASTFLITLSYLTQANRMQE